MFKGGSAAEHLQHWICLCLFGFCQDHRIELIPDWIPLKKNLLADYLLKVLEVDDFSLQPAVFEGILCDFTPLNFDRLASAHNAQLPAFNSENWCPESSGVNAFTFD
jgi:hypothetical protein